MKGKLITVEGVEGVGKSSNITFIRQRLESLGHKVTTTREPGGTQTGEAIRALLLSNKLPEMHADTELLLMYAARAEHLQTVILPALERGEWVVCDRFADASHAYQGGGRGIETTRISALDDWVLGDLRPDLTLLLDIDVTTGLARARGRSEADRFEQQTINFFERVRSRYLQLADQHSTRFVVIDAAPELHEVQASISVALNDWLAACTT